MEHIADPTDQALQHAVEVALSETFSQLATHVGVAADRGTVTLSGDLLTETDRLATIAATIAVEGVRALADEIHVHTRQTAPTNTEIASAAAEALKRAEDVPHGAVIVEVTEDAVTLTGTVRTPGERLAAERAVAYVRGVERIDNQLLWASPAQVR